jgi:hypothetical protein
VNLNVRHVVTPAGPLKAVMAVATFYQLVASHHGDKQGLVGIGR